MGQGAQASKLEPAVRRMLVGRQQVERNLSDAVAVAGDSLDVPPTSRAVWSRITTSVYRLSPAWLATVRTTSH